MYIYRLKTELRNLTGRWRKLFTTLDGAYRYMRRARYFGAVGRGKFLPNRAFFLFRRRRTDADTRIRYNMLIK